ncbi:hypothetical protein A2526_05685 [candidate division WOR-1 bacterium RIFOXYD2_FULL_36_8]|uniref:Uncharacterized protein n=1 Tax=candidate division WOR-1 bacterium RIFOXYB2_FULL_36_35 TaxID=1802578 RepID=A0A1F4S2W5_UNCSA|nr:MAG: hypothetical protein A2230_07480 [candidate division WOR-1 bacterium RIFOXYA2_FULL_36_21]OGC14771.1 MAG: hypothetical protein A2290_08765 [candidate division WOR-1 bacterium RIFOXYB2_FULL_36_35]OGC16952.1 MAG: hypothetical protein A2282_08630 [candidate division WOR-1 bacterium RIFOXYA12_FULL_36_13]OGC37902.1 MAG: hypothetical protein A2526_05685 [candidate division WOR-1 bacterium RIFOXYD2_FULL_36_8]
MTDLNSKLQKQLIDFLGIYSILTSQARAELEAKLYAVMEKSDPKTKKMYRSIIQSAKENLSVTETIENLKKDCPPD